MICTLILVAPLFFVNPIGPRCFLAPYFVLAMTAVTLINYLISQFEISKRSIKYLSVLSIAGILSALLFFFTIYVPINHYSNLRDEYVRAQVELSDNDTIYICNLPYGNFTWTADPTKVDFLRERYLLFNNIETDAEFKGKDYDKFEAWTKKFNKKTGYQPKTKPRSTKSRFYREETTEKKE